MAGHEAGERQTNTHMHNLYVDTREGPAFASIPQDVAAAMESAAASEGELDLAMELAGLVLVRLGVEAGTVMLRHWAQHDPGLLLHADPQLAEALAHEPELIVGTLSGSQGRR